MKNIHFKIICTAIILGLLLHSNCLPMSSMCGMGGMRGHQQHETVEPMTEGKKVSNFRFSNYVMKITCSPYPILPNAESKLDIVINDINNDDPVADAQIELITRKNDVTNLNKSDEIVNHKVWTKKDGTTIVNVTVPESGSFSFEFQITIENKTFTIISTEEVKEISHKGHEHTH